MKRQTVQATISAAKEERPVAELVQLANRFKSSIYFETSNKVINAKSIMGMMTLNLISGLDVTITADGEDEEVAVEQLAAYITGK
ncbi:MAG: HPr family phosphocarrier protein [Lachnospiraceae bacterium]|jgi:catabolite repression HPr-like protein|nr:HPr family phosphocarrier protein [Lachnospiraceae bacterium]